MAVAVDRGRVAAALSGYELGRQLGAGAFGLVLAARHVGLDRDVAVKVLSATDTSLSPDELRREARVLARLDHPHIVKVFDYVERDDMRLVIMELLSGGTLTRHRRELTLAGKCAVGLAAADALAHAHALGILHRDVKPDNMIFSGSRLLKVTDFGIAKLIAGTTATASAVIGTPKYMAPEQIQARQLRAQTDLYALAVVLYELLSGRPTFDPTMPLMELYRHHLDVMPPPPPGVPGPIGEVVLRSLAKDPAHRHPSAHAFAIDLATATTMVAGPGWITEAGVRLEVSDAVRDATRTAARPSTRTAAGAATGSPVEVVPPPGQRGRGDTSAPIEPTAQTRLAGPAQPTGPIGHAGPATPPGPARWPGPVQPPRPSGPPWPSGPSGPSGPGNDRGRRSRTRRRQAIVSALALLVALAVAVPVALNLNGNDPTTPSSGPRSSDSRDAAGYSMQPAANVPASPTLDAITSRGKIIVGTKFDQPLFGLQNPTNSMVEGFDTEIARLLAIRIFGDSRKVEFVEAVSKDREPFLEGGRVDAVVATYTINDVRKQRVSFAGPYYFAGQDIMVKIDNSSITSVDDLNGETVCSVSGSTSAQNLTARAPLAQPYFIDSYSGCAQELRDGRVSAVTTDNTILNGLISQSPGEFKLVGKPFTEEPYGIGLPRTDDVFRNFVNDTLDLAYSNGDWVKAFESTVGTVEDNTPSPPAVDRYARGGA